ncbi:MAG: class I SAM-dependent methyltransferase [Solirubrobacteraceae bacterium]
MSTDTWAEASRPFADAIVAYYEGRGRAPSDPAVQSTITTNTEQVPGRARNLMTLLEELASVVGIEGKRVLEAGCGFGALATYLAWTQWPARLDAVDVRADLIEIAQRASAGLEVAELGFRVDDMRRLESFPDHQVDLVILNNALVYISSARGVEECLEAIARVLAPGGHVLFYHANKWTARAPFSGDPIVHVLPPRLARAVGALTGWKHDHSRVRLMSPRELRRGCKKAGLVSFQAGAHVSGGELRRGLRLGGVTFYGATARLPAGWTPFLGPPRVRAWRM